MLQQKGSQKSTHYNTPRFFPFFHYKNKASWQLRDFPLIACSHDKNRQICHPIYALKVLRGKTSAVSYAPPREG